MFSGHALLEGQYARLIIYTICFGNISGNHPRRSCKVLLGRGMIRMICLACCHRDQILDKPLDDGWMDGWIDIVMVLQSYKFGKSWFVSRWIASFYYFILQIIYLHSWQVNWITVIILLKFNNQLRNFEPWHSCGWHIPPNNNAIVIGSNND